MTYLALLFFFVARVACACSCRHLSECELAQQPVVFVGKVVAGGVGSLRDDPWQKDPGFVRFEVLEAFRGVAPGTKFVEVKTMLWPEMCSPNPYRPGQSYLVSPSERDGKYTDGFCFSGRDVQHVGDILAYLRRYFGNPSELHIRGRVGAVQRNDFSLVAYLLNQGEGKPLQGVRVQTLINGRSVSATTDAAGRYELKIPAPGRYSVEAELGPYQSEKSLIDVPAPGPCTVRDFGLLSGSSISGKVWDTDGRLVQHARVGLIDLDRTETGQSNRASFRTAYPEERDGGFLFKNVPIGRYLLVFNPDGPQADGYAPLPLESSFHSSGAGRAGAQVIEVTRGGMNITGTDLIAGPPVTFRAVSVKVRFPDGSPMTTAFVEIVGEPIETGGLLWHGGGYIRKERKELRFQVPSNRRFRISVSDAYGRDLLKKYESVHLPGRTPVTQEFVIDVG